MAVGETGVLAALLLYALLSSLCVNPSYSKVEVNLNNLVFTEEQISVFASNGLHCFHLNIRSLLPKITEVRELARKIKASILCLSETWLDFYITDSEVEIENFVIIRKDRNRQGGGVCIFVKSDIDFNIRQDLVNVNLEAVWIDILLPKSKPILCGVVYRPPNQNDFIQTLEYVSAGCHDFLNQEVILMADNNIDVLNTEGPL